MLASPFSKFKKATKNKLSLILLIATFISLFCMLYFDSFLKNEVAKNGIVSFQLAGDLQTTKTILNSWNSKAKIYAGLSLGYDFLFLMLYPLLIALFIHLLNEKLWKKSSFYNIGIILIYALFFAAVFDLIENIALIQLLLGNLQQLSVSIAYYLAMAKFIILLLAILYILFNFMYLQLKKRTHE